MFLVAMGQFHVTEWRAKCENDSYMRTSYIISWNNLLGANQDVSQQVSQ